ncbi:HNH endonuclease [Chromobacterium sp.]|uniref:HNH endonuclease n=1 Tax=Chromobacterium sp. TaxID=306190 RepID=UPI0035B1351A
MNFFWVNIGTTNKEVREGEFLWAPISTMDAYGNEVFPRHWSNVGDVKKGDVIFCCFNQHIHYIAEAKKHAYRSPRPVSRSFKEWDQEGFRVDVNLKELEEPLHYDAVSQFFSIKAMDKASPTLFTKKKTLSQIYMASLSPRAGLYLLEATSQTENFQDLLGIDEPSNKKISETTRKALMQARIGQGKFRKDLIGMWGGRCALTGVENPDLLIASHIVPWSQCGNEARLDPENGLLLAAHIDRLFDKGLISFDVNGQLIISSRLKSLECKVFGLTQGMTLRKNSEKKQQYLALHRANFFNP